MKYYVETLQAIFTCIHNTISDETSASLQLLLQHIYTYSYIRTHLIEEPLSKYPFITKDASLKKVYSLVNSTITHFMEVYLQRNQTDLITMLRQGYKKDWGQYRTLQPFRTDIAFFLTSLTLVSGDISLYMGVK